MKLGIVGSRSFPQLQLVEWFVRDLPLGVVVVSGGAIGVDSAAAEYARARGLEVVEYLPDLKGAVERTDFTQRYYARNQKIVDASDLIIAFTEKDRGGTWDTIKRARLANKPVKIIRPSAFFPPEDKKDSEKVQELEKESTGEPEQLSFDDGKQKGAGPFQIRRVSLGSYALRRKSYIAGEEWADIVTKKDSDPAGLAKLMVPAFLEFFEKNERLGIIHAVTVPPRSIRNLEKKHVMDIAARKVAAAVGAEFVTMFKPWNKSTRGRFAQHAEIEILPGVEKYVGQVVWVLDDITTTNYTLRSAVRALMALEIHSHGLAYVYIA